MKLTKRDEEIIQFIQISGGATIEHIEKMFFPSYKRTSKRLKQLSDYGYIKHGMQPTMGKNVYFLDKIPSYHTLITNEILIALRGKYKASQRNVKVGTCEVDLVVKLNTGKYVLFEIEIFNKVSKGKIQKIKAGMEELSYDLWIISRWASDKRRGKITIDRITEISNLY